MALRAADEAVVAKDGFVLIQRLGDQELVPVIQIEMAIVVVRLAADDLAGVDETGFFQRGQSDAVFRVDVFRSIHDRLPHRAL